MSTMNSDGILEEMDSFASDIQSYVDTCSGSPDMAELGRRKAHLFFFYNNFMLGHKENALIQKYGARRLTGCFTSLSLFQLFEYQNKKKEANAIAMYSTKKELTGKIHGDLWLVPPSLISQLDFQFGNLENVKRVKTNFTFHNPHNAAQKLSANAMMYIGRATEWEKEELKLLKLRHFHSNPEDKFFSYQPRKNEYQFPKKPTGECKLS